MKTPLLLTVSILLASLAGWNLLADPGQTTKAPTINGPLLLDSTPTAARNPMDLKEVTSPWLSRMEVALEVLVDGRPQATVRHVGRTYLPVRRVGAEYEIRVWNHGPNRITAILSVDGLSVINGEPASEDHPGYIVAPYGHIDIKGWRRNRDVAAAFRFVDRDRSYANLIGRPENVGVIGLVASRK
jgi:hypothetical protein